MTAIANGITLSECRVVVPWRGAMVIDMVATEPVIAPGDSVALVFLDMTIVCTLIEGRFGQFSGQWYGRAVSGRAGWRKIIPAKGYRSLAGLVSTQIFADAALSCGELPPFVSVPQVLGGFYVREEGPASNVFQLLPPEIDWWVPASGVTQVGLRIDPIPAIAPIEIISGERNRGRLIVATDSPSAYMPGVSFLDPASETLQQIDLVTWICTPDNVRGELWTV